MSEGPFPLQTMSAEVSCFSLQGIGDGGGVEYIPGVVSEAIRLTVWPKLPSDACSECAAIRPTA